MQAILAVGPERMRFLEVDDAVPSTLAPDEIEGTTLATLISPGTELAITRVAGMAFPRPTGYAAVFEVDRVGSAVEGVEVGDRMFSLSPHRSRQRVRVSEALPVPRGLDPARAVFARLLAVSWPAIATTSVAPPARALVTGLGIIGHLAAQNLTRLGYRVTAVDPLESRRELARTHGIPSAFDEVPDEEFDLAVDCSGHDGAALAALRRVRAGGECILVGTHWARRTDAFASEVFGHVMTGGISLRSGWEMKLPPIRESGESGAGLALHGEALDALAEGGIRVDALGDRVHPRHAARVYSELSGSDRLTTVFDWSD
jgi:threonine dehydrogenase-like Zn-dependent dehydrogenase